MQPLEGPGMVSESHCHHHQVAANCEGTVLRGLGDMLYIPCQDCQGIYKKLGETVHGDPTCCVTRMG